MLSSVVFLIDRKLKCCLGNSLYLDLLGRGKMLVQVVYGKGRLFSYQPSTTNPVFPKNNFHNSHYCNNLSNLCYFCCSKMCFFMTVELPYNQHNNTISLISQVLIGPYLTYSVHPHLLLGLGRVSIFLGGCWERGGDLFQDDWVQLLHKR